MWKRVRINMKVLYVAVDWMNDGVKKGRDEVLVPP
jgi:hypothetical protein